MLILFFILFSLVSGSCTIAMPRIKEHTGRLSSATVEILTNIGDHILAQEFQDAPRLGRVPSFLSRVPAPIRRMLGRAYSEMFLLDDNCLALAYLNGDSPNNYPDQKKRDRACLLLATPQLVDQELDRVSSLAAVQAGLLYGLI
jgi:hypothetical protein